MKPKLVYENDLFNRTSWSQKVNNTCTHTTHNTHCFNGHFPCKPGLAGCFPWFSASTYCETEPVTITGEGFVQTGSSPYHPTNSDKALTPNHPMDISFFDPITAPDRRDVMLPLYQPPTPVSSRCATANTGILQLFFFNNRQISQRFTVNLFIS